VAAYAQQPARLHVVPSCKSKQRERSASTDTSQRRLRTGMIRLTTAISSKERGADHADHISKQGAMHHERRIASSSSEGVHTMIEVEELRLAVEGGEVGVLLTRPDKADAAFVFAHGAGAGMRHAFMEAFAMGLAERGIASLRYQFPFMEKASRRTDRPDVAHATVRAACAMAGREFAGVTLLAGGKSFGGRMTSQAQGLEPLPAVAGLVFVGFPLHPAGQPSVLRAAHLVDIEIPMLFLQGTRDELADLALITEVVTPLADRAQLVLFDDADHAFHVRKKSGSDDARTLAAMADATAGWVSRLPRSR
jgi:predicted alpha/beta-hydrolase family hydrolase